MSTEANAETNPGQAVEQAAPVEQAAIKAKAVLEILETPGAEDYMKIIQATAVLKG